MKQLVRLAMRPSRDGKSFVYRLDYVDTHGKRRRVSLGRADKRKAEKERAQKEKLLRMGPCRLAQCGLATLWPTAS